jgi:hypothetical protein
VLNHGYRDACLWALYHDYEVYAVAKGSGSRTVWPPALTLICAACSQVVVPADERSAWPAVFRRGVVAGRRRDGRVGEAGPRSVRIADR